MSGIDRTLRVTISRSNNYGESWGTVHRPECKYVRSTRTDGTGYLRGLNYAECVSRAGSRSHFKMCGVCKPEPVTQ